MEPDNRIKEVIEASEYKFIEIAAELNITDRQLRNYMTGRTSPRLETIYRLAEVLKVAPEEFLISPRKKGGRLVSETAA